MPVPCETRRSVAIAPPQSFCADGEIFSGEFGHVRSRHERTTEAAETRRRTGKAGGNPAVLPSPDAVAGCARFPGPGPSVTRPKATIAARLAAMVAWLINGRDPAKATALMAVNSSDGRKPPASRTAMTTAWRRGLEQAIDQEEACRQKRALNRARCEAELI